jgi:uroporphyrinogen decarboxylase
MRQAGRYLPEYRQVREKYSFLEMCRLPDVAAEVTLQPLRRFELDAAILFSDILIPLPPMGIKLDFYESKGPVIENPVRKLQDIEALRVPDPYEDIGFVAEAIKLIKQELKDEKALIGFAGAPFTLASYVVEGGHSKNYIKVKQLMWNEPGTFDLLMEKITSTIIGYLSMQLEAGADVVQLFDSWIGALSPVDFETKALPYINRIFEALKKYKRPTIYFGTMTAGFLKLISQVRSSAAGVDWRVNIDEAWDMIGHQKAIQGNLDPIVLYAEGEVIKSKAEEILLRVGNRPGHVFNLGHGLTPETPIDSVKLLVDFVHERSAEIRNA